MIFSDRQYQISREELAKLQRALADALAPSGDGEGWVGEIQADALRSQIADIEAELVEYDLLKKGEIGFSESSSLSDLPRVLVQARIAKAD